MVGDACQAIHPIAGQGLNLGLRDSYHLANIISNSLELGLDIGSTYVLRDYSLKRLVDKKLLIQATHRLNQLFVPFYLIAFLTQHHNYSFSYLI